MFKKSEEIKVAKILQGITVEDLKKISLNTPVYHPFLGKGMPIKIESSEITVKYREAVQCKYSTSGSTSDGQFLHHLFLKPIEIIYKD